MAPPGHPPRGVGEGKRPTVSPMGLVENVLLKGLLLLDTGVGVVIVLVRGKETGWAVKSWKPRMISDCFALGLGLLPFKGWGEEKY